MIFFNEKPTRGNLYMVAEIIPNEGNARRLKLLGAKKTAVPSTVDRNTSHAVWTAKFETETGEEVIEEIDWPIS